MRREGLIAEHRDRAARKKTGRHLRNWYRSLDEFPWLRWDLEQKMLYLICSRMAAYELEDQAMAARIAELEGRLSARECQLRGALVYGGRRGGKTETIMALARDEGRKAGLVEASQIAEDLPKSGEDPHAWPERIRAAILARLP